MRVHVFSHTHEMDDFHQDENKDGLFTVDEFKRWIETSKM
jgi:hypothetical protein